MVGKLIFPPILIRSSDHQCVVNSPLTDTFCLLTNSVFASDFFLIYCQNVNSDTAYNHSFAGRYRELKRKCKRYQQALGLSFASYCRIASKRCHYCAEIVSGAGYGIDRLDSRKGYTPRNCVSCCWRCNRVKSDVLTAPQMLRVAKMLFR